MRRHFISLAMVLVIVAAFGCSDTPEQQQADLVSDGMEQLEKFELDGADSAFARLGREFPSNLDGRFGAGLVLEGRVLYYDALEIYMQVSEADPAHLESRLAVARMYSRLGWPEYAANTLREAASLPSDKGRTLALLVSSLIDAWQLDQARAILDSSISSSIDPADAAILSASFNYAASGKSELVSPNLDQATPLTLSLLADYYEKRGMIDSGIMAGQRAMEAAGSRFYHHQGQFERLIRNEYFDDAWSMVELADRSDRSGSLADRSDKSGSLADAMRMRYGWVSGDPNLATKATARYMRVHGDRIAGLFSDLKSLWMVSNLAACQDNTVMIFNRLRDSTESDEFDDFVGAEIEFASHIFGAVPGVGDALPGLAGYQRGEARFVTVYARMKHRFGGDKASDEMVDSLFYEHESDPIWLKGLGDVYIEGKGNIEKASQYYGAALEVMPSYRPAFTAWLDLLEAKGEYAKALDLCDQFSELVNANPILSLRKAEYLSRQGVDDEAHKIFESSFQNAKGRISAAVTMAELAFAHGNDVAAWEIVDNALASTSGSARAYEAFAGLPFVLGDSTRLTDLVRNGLELHPGSIPLRAIRAGMIGLEGSTEEAAAMFAQIEKDKNLLPGWADAAIYYSRYLADSQIEQSRAENLARGAIILDRASERALINLAYVYCQYGRFDLARGEARRACSSYPSSPEAFYFLGLSYYKTDHPDARKGLDRAIELGLKGDRLTKAKEMLDQL